MLDVTIEMPGKKIRSDTSGATLARALRGSAAGIAHALALSIKRRVSIQGQTHQGSFRYSSSKRAKYISPKYPARGGAKTKTGAFIYSSSAHFHAAMGTKPNTFNTNKTSGMWSGLAVQILAVNKTRIAFRGRSQGQGMSGTIRKGGKATEPHWRIMASGKKKARGKKISNALKAATVWQTCKVSLLAPSQREMEQIGRAMVAVIAKKGLSTVAGRKIKVPKIPESKFIDLVMRAQLGPGKVRR